MCARGARPTGGGHTCTCSKNTAPTRTRRDMTDQPVAESYMKPVDHGLRPHGHPARHLHDGADGPAPGGACMREPAQQSRSRAGRRRAEK